MKKIPMFTVLILCGCLLAAISGCSKSHNSNPTAPATYDITGNWAYTMLKGNNTWDAGLFAFSGSATSGTYTQLNIYALIFSGSYTVSGVNVALSGPETFTGTFTDASHMAGTWQSTTDTTEGGLWTAVKQQ